MDIKRPKPKCREIINIIHDADGNYVVEFREVYKRRDDIITVYLVQPDGVDGERRNVWVVEHANPKPDDGGPYRTSSTYCGCKGNVCRLQAICCRHQRMIEEVVAFRDREELAVSMVRSLLGYDD